MTAGTQKSKTVGELEPADGFFLCEENEIGANHVTFRCC
jgi:hypothetical protein